MRLVRLVVWVMTWAALGYLWKERIAYRERLPAAQLIAASPPPFALSPPEVIDLPALVPPRPDAPEEMVTLLAPSPAAAPLAKQQIRAANVERMALHSRTAGLALAVIVTGAAVGAVVIWVLSAVPGLQ